MLLPPGWRKPADERSRSFGLWDRMTRNATVVDIKMYDEKESSLFFNKDVSIRFDLVVIHNVEPSQSYKTTKIRGTDGKNYAENLLKYPFLPNAHFGYWKKILRMEGKKTLNTTYSASTYYSNNKNVSREYNNKFKFPVVHSIHKDGKPVLLYTDKKNMKGGFGVPKLIFNRLGAWNPPILDLKGKYGMSQDTFGIVIKNEEEGNNIKKFFTKDALKKWQYDMTWATSKPSVFWKLFRFVINNFYSI